MTSNLLYRVKTFRDAGLEAKWTHTRRGKPYIAVRNPKSKLPHQRDRWWMVDHNMFVRMKESGVVEGFDQATLLADVFSIPV